MRVCLRACVRACVRVHVSANLFSVIYQQFPLPWSSSRAHCYLLAAASWRRGRSSSCSSRLANFALLGRLCHGQRKVASPRYCGGGRQGHAKGEDEKNLQVCRLVASTCSLSARFCPRHTTFASPHCPPAAKYGQPRLPTEGCFFPFWQVPSYAGALNMSKIRAAIASQSTHQIEAWIFLFSLEDREKEEDLLSRTAGQHLLRYLRRQRSGEKVGNNHASLRKDEKFVSTRRTFDAEASAACTDPSLSITIISLRSTKSVWSLWNTRLLKWRGWTRIHRQKQENYRLLQPNRSYVLNFSSASTSSSKEVCCQSLHGLHDRLSRTRKLQSVQPSRIYVLNFSSASTSSKKFAVAVTVNTKSTAHRQICSQVLHAYSRFDRTGPSYRVHHVSCSRQTVHG